ncbi:DUF2480 family protein [Nemorincola caseinilytica]|uniref:DUF2480 family protein n=2 Tax=Nemorincola caseinilytica TaxID=2054315 RepID=A0ABP8NGU7_9BACT
METIINKVAESGIITLDLAPYLPTSEVVAFDLKPFLFREMILREKDYRTALQAVDWQQYTGKHVAVFCSTDAIIPVWAYMLAASYLQPVASSVFHGTPDELTKHLLNKNIDAIPLDEYTDKRVVIKGCGDTPIPDAAYLAVTAHLRPVVKSLMYGEPCSTVPVYKKKG